MAKMKKDLYPNRAIEALTQSALNTLTYGQIRFGIGLFQGVALVLHRVDWYPDVGCLRELVAATDSVEFAIITTDGLASITDILESSIVCLKKMIGVAPNVALMEVPMVQDFSNLPGGGLILPPNPLYLAMNSSGFAGAQTVRVLLYFTFIELNDRDYIELIQASIPANI